MRNGLASCALILAACWFSVVAKGSTIPIGYITWDINLPGSTGEFDIINLTGPYASVLPDSTFPVLTLVHLSNLSLEVNFSNGTSVTYGPSYFTSGSDGSSLEGASIPFGGNSLPVSATLTGTLSPGSVSLSSGGTASLDSSFTATISPGKAILSANDPIAAVDPDTPSIPEPGAWMLTAIGIGFLAFAKATYFLRS